MLPDCIEALIATDRTVVAFALFATSFVLALKAICPRQNKDPTILYHGSPRSLDLVEPRPNKIVNNLPCVFGTNTPWLALIFSAGPSVKGLDYGFINGQGYVVEMVDGAFEQLNRGGYVHMLAAEGFRSDLRLGMPNHEFIKEGSAPVLGQVLIANIMRSLRKQPKLLIVPANDRERFLRETGIQT
jgi:hypothetical protein